MTPPTFAEQHRFEKALHHVLRRAHERATGRPPTEPELAQLVELEIEQLRGNGDDEVIARALAADPVLVPPEPDLIAAWMTQRQRHEAEQSLWYAKLNGISSIPEALSWYVTYSQAAKVAPPLRTCVEEFIRVRRAQGIRPYTCRKYEASFKTLIAALGDRMPRSITASELGTHLARWENPGTRRSHWEALRALWIWLVKSGYALRNPVTESLHAPEVKRTPGLIYTPAEAKLILAHVKHTDQIGFWALSLFAGLARSEIEQLQRHVNRRGMIKRKRGFIELDSTVSADPRHITILPVLDRWLEWIEQHAVPLYPENHFGKLRVTRAIALASRYADDAEKQAGNQAHTVRGKATCGMARRSFIAYRLAFDGAGFAVIADEVARHETNLRSKFFRKASHADAEEYFALGPEAV